MVDQVTGTECGGPGTGIEPGAADRCVEALEQVIPRVGRVVKSQMREGPLTIQQMFMLREIQDGARPGELARRCGISSSATTAALDGLVRGGYCVRSHGEKDRREVLVQMTPAGTEALAAAHRGAHAALREILAGWDDEKLRRLLAALRDLDASIGAYLERHGR